MEVHQSRLFKDASFSSSVSPTWFPTATDFPISAPVVRHHVAVLALIEVSRGWETASTCRDIRRGGVRRTNVEELEYDISSPSCWPIHKCETPFSQSRSACGSLPARSNEKEKQQAPSRGVTPLRRFLFQTREPLSGGALHCARALSVLLVPRIIERLGRQPLPP